MEHLPTAESTLSEDQKVLKEFNTSMNTFINKVHSFTGSKKQLQRVMMNLALHPLNKEELHFSYPEEKELFELGTSVNSTKFFLLVSGLESEGKIKFIENEPKGEENANQTT